ncbi:hypothetical protein GGI35DRAFT_492031 [Trichoderma velutinum]
MSIMAKFKLTLCTAWLALATIAAAKGLHLSTKGLLQIPPSFAGNGVFMYPGHHPDHDADDFVHLTPRGSNELYYSQEGHRPAIHGSKHGSLKATFVRPTVVLDHSNHLREVKCSHSSIRVCFTSPQAYRVAQGSWHLDDFNLATYHIGCGDEDSGTRSFYHATKDVVFDAPTLCVKVAVTRILEQSALDSAELSWGTYQNPDHRKRTPVRGHIRMVDQSAGIDETDDDAVDITHNVTALQNFFQDSNIDTSHMQDPVPESEVPEFIDMNGTVSKRAFARRNVLQRAPSHREGKRMFEGLYDGITNFFKTVGDFFTTSSQEVTSFAKSVTKVAITTAKIIAVPLGVPFDESYHHDFTIENYLKAEFTNKPPQVFGIGEGFSLAGTGAEYSVQCAKCGIQGKFSVDGYLAFSLKNGLTQGRVVLVNKDAFTVDIQIGISITRQILKPMKEGVASKQLAAVPLTPITIPGVLALGPQISINSALEILLSGQAELLVGGTLSFGTGKVSLNLVSKEENKLEGFGIKFEPVFKANGTLTATLELGLPIALEFGLNILNGKFKKTVSLINKPSIYASATVPGIDGRKCKGGLEVRAGIQNQIIISAFDLWDHVMSSTTVYEKGLVCVTTNGIDMAAVEPTASVFNDVIKKFGRDLVGTSMPTSTDVAGKMTPAKGRAGFRIVMDKSKTSILVSGKDGYIYLVHTDEEYDISSPWGTIDLPTDIVNMDVFGRIMSNELDTSAGSAAQVSVHDPTKIPSNKEAAGLIDLETSSKDSQAYGVALRSRNEVLFYYPTFCPTDVGLRLFGTNYTIDENGEIGAPSPESRASLIKGLGQFDVKDASKCRTLWLTSNIQQM